MKLKFYHKWQKIEGQKIYNLFCYIPTYISTNGFLSKKIAKKAMKEALKTYYKYRRTVKEQ